MRIKIFLVLLCVNLVATAETDITKESNKNENLKEIDYKLLACKEIKESVTRLECFDEYISTNYLSEKNEKKDETEIIKEPERIKTYWVAHNEIDPITDKRNYVISKSAIDSIGSNMYIRCKNNKTELLLSTSEFLGLDSVKITTRIDKLEPSTSYWSTSSDGTVVFHPKPIQFIKDMIGKDKVTLRVFGYSIVETISFDISTLDIGVKDLRKECGW